MAQINVAIPVYNVKLMMSLSFPFLLCHTFLLIFLVFLSFPSLLAVLGGALGSLYPKVFMLLSLKLWKLTYIPLIVGYGRDSLVT